MLRLRKPMLLCTIISIALPLSATPDFGEEDTPHKSLSLIEAQQIQAMFDETNWDINDGFEKLRHIFLHLSQSMGMIAKYVDVKEHGKEPNSSPLLNEALPDLLLHTLQIANLYDIDIGDKYRERIEFLIHRNSMNRQATHE